MSSRLNGTLVIFDIYKAVCSQIRLYMPDNVIYPYASFSD